MFSAVRKTVLRRHTVFFAFDFGVIHTVPAFVTVKFGFHRFPPGRPDRITVFDIEIPSATVHGYIIVPVTCNAAEFGIFIKSITPGSIGYQRKEILISQIIDPWPWGTADW